MKTYLKNFEYTEIECELMDLELLFSEYSYGRIKYWFIFGNFNGSYFYFSFINKEIELFSIGDFNFITNKFWFSI